MHSASLNLSFDVSKSSFSIIDEFSSNLKFDLFRWLHKLEPLRIYEHSNYVYSIFVEKAKLIFLLEILENLAKIT